MNISDLTPDELAALAKLRRADATWPRTRWFILFFALVSLAISTYGRYRQGEALVELAKAPPGAISPVLLTYVAQNASLFKVLFLLSAGTIGFVIMAWRGIPSRKLLLRLMADRESRR
jgi:hypothetical protein